jgi:hypothetical protein
MCFIEPLISAENVYHKIHLSSSGEAAVHKFMPWFSGYFLGEDIWCLVSDVTPLFLLMLKNGIRLKTKSVLGSGSLNFWIWTYWI